jgi:AraC-like DNA-binding protein
MMADYNLNHSELNAGKLYIDNLPEFLQYDKSKDHFINGALVCFCRQGYCTIKINFTLHRITQNDALIILPTHMFSIEDCSNDFKVDALIYTNDYWSSVAQSINYTILKKVEFHPLVNLTEEKRNEIEPLLHIIIEREKGEVSTIERSIIGCIAYSLLMILAVTIDNNIDTDLPRIVSRKEELTRRFFDLLSEHFKTERQVAFYASKLCVTPKHLSMCVKDITKLSILDWVNNATILSIKRRLRTTNDTIQQISEDFNFQTASTFSRYFRQHTGMTPLKFRNSD